jgi:multidrug efflux pump subunit AcrB
MNAFAKLLGQTRLVLTSAVLLSLLGALAWIVMPRQEDPAMERRFGLVTVAFPGADAETVERLVVEPLEEELAQVDALKRVDSRSRAAFAVVNVEFRDDTDDFDDAWERVEEAVARAQPRFPAGVLDPVIDRDTIDQDSVVVAITGSGDPLVRADSSAPCCASPTCRPCISSPIPASRSRSSTTRRRRPSSGSIPARSRPRCRHAT